MKGAAERTLIWVVSSEGYAGRLEVIEDATGQRRRSDTEKARIVVESRVPEVACKHRATLLRTSE